MSSFLCLCALVSALLAMGAAQAPRDENELCTVTLPNLENPQNVFIDPPNEKVLMDTTHYADLVRSVGNTYPPVWQTLDLDDNNAPGIATSWSETGSVCVSTVAACGFTQGPQNNWMITQHINRTLANGNRLDQVILRVSYQQTGCPDDTTCQRVFDIRKYETSTIDPAAARDTSNYVLVESFTTRTTSGDVTETDQVAINFNSNESGFYLAIQDRGTCILIERLTVFYYVCPAESVDGVARPDTLPPPVGNVDTVQITAPCIENAMPEGGPPVQSCLERGRWLTITPGTGCICNEGFVSTANNTRCITCEAGMYASVANGMCLSCPNNSNSTESGLPECPCDEGFYRTPQEIDLPCTLPPSEPRNVMVLNTTTTTITLSWEEPLSLGGRSSEELMYNLWYQAPGDSQPQLATTVSTTMGQITDLTPNVAYMVFVSSETAITAQIPVADLENRAEVFSVRTRSTDVGLIAGIIVAVIVVIVILVVVVLLLCCLRKQKKIVKETISHYQAENTIALPRVGKRMYVDPTTYSSPDDAIKDFAKEIPPRSVKLVSEIGAGEFGNVYKGTWKDQGKQIPIAVKTLRGGSNKKQRSDFLTEASIMGQFDHPNVIKLHGVVTRVEPVMIVMEFMDNGSLYHYLRKHDDKLGAVRQIKMAKQVAEGMDYLATVGFVHRDLAARNILVGQTEECKVADFGLSRETVDDEYDVKTGGKIPVRWTAPEAIFRRRFTTASDVWSYGVLLWEVMSYGQHPYEAFDWDNQTVLDKIDAGYRLDQPDGCPLGVYQLMLNCWHAEKNDRPTFTEIVQYINRLLENNFETSMSNPAPAKKVPRTYLTTANILNPLDYTSIEEWLTAIKMDKYLINFTEAGITELSQVLNLTETHIRGLGVNLAGHVYRITTSIEKAQTQISRQPSVKV